MMIRRMMEMYTPQFEIKNEKDGLAYGDTSYTESYADLGSGGVYHEHYSDCGRYLDWDSDEDPK